MNVIWTSHWKCLSNALEMCKEKIHRICAIIRVTQIKKMILTFPFKFYVLMFFFGLCKRFLVHLKFFLEGHICNVFSVERSILILKEQCVYLFSQTSNYIRHLAWPKSIVPQYYFFSIICLNVIILKGSYERPNNQSTEKKKKKKEQTWILVINLEGLYFWYPGTIFSCFFLSLFSYSSLRVGL